MDKNKQKKILVTGGAGYIGSVLTKFLLEKNHQVVVLDSFLFGHNFLKPFADSENLEIIKGDIGNSGDVRQAMAEVEAVVHLAAVVGDPACKKFPDEAKRVNKEGAELLCKMALENNIRRFIFASTCSNYGKMVDPEGFVDETTELNPVSLYAEQKVGFENFLFDQKEDWFEPVILRFATAFGLSPRPRFDLTVNEFTRDLVLGKKLEIFGEQFWRPYCHTLDLAQACYLAVVSDSEVCGGEAFNVGSNAENYQKITLVDKILKIEPDKKNLVNYVKRNEDPRDYRVKFDKIASQLEFKTTMTVDDGIEEIRQAIITKVIDDPYDKQYRNL